MQRPWLRMSENKALAGSKWASRRMVGDGWVRPSGLGTEALICCSEGAGFLIDRTNISKTWPQAAHWGRNRKGNTFV